MINRSVLLKKLLIDKYIIVLGMQKIHPKTITAFQLRSNGRLNIQPIIIIKKIKEAENAIIPIVKVKISSSVIRSCKVRICKKRISGEF